MKKFLCGFCSLTIIVICLSGCGKAVENDVIDDTSMSEQATEDNSVNIFNDEDSITVVSGNLSYSIPGSVKDQYDELQKDKGFELPSFQKYNIDSLGEIDIYQANMFYNKEIFLNLSDIGMSFMKVSNTRYGLFDKDELYDFSSFNGVSVDFGTDMYMYTDTDDIKKAELYSIELEEGEQRVLFFDKDLSVYLIIIKCELGKYNKQIVDTFLGSIKFISLKDF